MVSIISWSLPRTQLRPFRSQHQPREAPPPESPWPKRPATLQNAPTTSATPHYLNSGRPRGWRVKAPRGELWGLSLQKIDADWLLSEAGGIKDGSRHWGRAPWNWRLERSWKQLSVPSTVRGPPLLGAPGVCQSSLT